ncbi:MAG TPA: FtsQ-type POTRA domain-containing protein [Kofleriaceae bacterium]|nr:FtsQ-type POTRA domain-containing protein [Kofleriaceae bacterium]
MTISKVVTPTPLPARRRRASSSQNRRRPVPLRERLPSRGTLRSALARGGRAMLPAALTLVVLSGVAGSVALGYRWLTTSSRFALADLDVRGAEALAEDDVRRALAPAMGQNLFRVPLDALERRLRAEPWVAHAAIRRRLPDSLVVDIEEHRPAAAERRVRAALEAAAIWRERPDRPALGELHHDAQRGVTLFTRAPVRALRVGRGRRGLLRKRMAAFDTAWAALAPAEREAAATFHLDRDGWPLRVTVGFAQARNNVQWPK